jgi:glycosyltransferase involved in cell wall biosynthesis
MTEQNQSIENRILFVGAYPPPFGGIASHLSDLAEVYKIQQRDIHIFDTTKRGIARSGERVFLRSPQGRAKALANPRNIVFILRNIVSVLRVCLLAVRFAAEKEYGWFFPITSILTIAEIIRAIDEFKITAISTYHTFPGGFYPFVVKRYFRPNLPYALTVFGELQADTINIQKHGALYREIVAGASLVMASSNYCGRGVEKLGLPFAGVRVVPYGVDLQHFRRRTPYVVNTSVPMVLFVGHINQRMGLECFIRAIAQVKKSNALRATIVGRDHGYLEQLKTLIAESGLSADVVLQHDVSYAALPGMYDEASVYVNTANTRLPCMGLSMKEAMAAELPVIASDAGGIPEAVIDGTTGFVFKTDDTEELAKKLAILISNLDKAKQFGTEGRKRAEAIFDRNKSSQIILNLLNDL